MKVSSYLFALLACSALPTNTAMARHHGHHFRGVSASKFHTHGLSKTSTTGSNQQDAGAKTQGIADHPAMAKDGSKLSGADTRTDDDNSVHGRKPGKSGVSDNRDSGTMHGSHAATAPSASLGAKESTADGAIDTRITVHQGRQFGKKDRQFKKPKSTVAVGTGLNLQYPRNGGLPARTLHRNAVGAIIDRDKRHDTAALTPAAAPVTGATKPTTDASALATGAPVHNSNTVATAVVGTTGVTKSSTAGAQDNNRAADNTALAIVTKNAPSINGTGFIRPGSSAGSIGGSPKIVAGAISGNSVHLKRP
jgi:hypothetical protein